MEASKKTIVLTAVVTTVLTLVVIAGIGAGVKYFRHGGEWGHKYEDYWKNKGGEKKTDKKGDKEGTGVDSDEGEVMGSDESKVNRYEGWNDYQSRNTGISLKYPRDFFIANDTLGDKDGDLSIYDEVSSSGPIGVNFSIFIEEVDNKFNTLDEFIQEEVRDKFNGQIYSDVKRVDIAGIKGVQVYDDRTKIDGIEGSYGKNTYVMSGGKTYSIVGFSYTKDVFDGFEDEYDMIVGSLGFER